MNVVGRGVAGVDLQVAALAPAQLLQGLCERRETRMSLRIVPSTEHADAPHPLWLLRARSERPRCRASEQRDESRRSRKPQGSGVR